MTSFWSAPARLTESNRKRTRTSPLSSRQEVGVASKASSLLSVGRLPVAPVEMASMFVNVQMLISSRSSKFSDRQVPPTLRRENIFDCAALRPTFNDGASRPNIPLPVLTSGAPVVGAGVVVPQSCCRRDLRDDSLRESAARGPTSSGSERSSMSSKDPPTTIRIVVGLSVPLLISSCDLRRICHTRHKCLLTIVLHLLLAVLCIIFK